MAGTPLPNTYPEHHRCPCPFFAFVWGFFAQTLTYTVYAYLHVLRLTHLCMHWADKYCGSFSPWQSTVKNWGVIIALGGGWCGNTRMAKYAWLPPKLQCCVMKYGCCRRGLPCDSFLVTFSLAFFFFFPLQPFTLRRRHFHLCLPIAVVIEQSASEHLLPLNAILAIM